MEREFGQPADFTFGEVGDELKVTGICPGCGALTSMTFSKGTPQGSKGIFRRTPAQPVRARIVTVYCQCGHVHADRPADSPENGCGAYWPVELA